MTPSLFKFSATGRAGEYEVFLRGQYTVLGVVEKRRGHNALGRPTNWWQARTGGFSLKDGGGQVAAKYYTRESAAQALYDHQKGN